MCYFSFKMLLILKFEGRASISPVLDALVTLLEVGQKRYRTLLDDRVRCFEYLQQQLTSVAERYGERLLHTPDNEISCAISLCRLGEQSRAAPRTNQPIVPNGPLEPQTQSTPISTAAAIDHATDSSTPTAVRQSPTMQPISPVASNSAASVSTSEDTRASTAFGAALFRKCVSGTRVVHPATVARFGAPELRGFGASFSEFPHAYMTAAAALGVTRDEIDVFARRLDHVFRKFCGTSSAGVPNDVSLHNYDISAGDIIDIEP